MKVIVGMSGGVDSAVAALRLLEQGHDVQALHMTNWDGDDDAYCTNAEDVQSAAACCRELGIPLHRVNFATQYRESVFTYLLEEYRRGRTPNPDVLCNREIKFGVFLRYARRLGGEAIATGHYARVRHTGSSPQLLKGVDPHKDQSYFLHAVSAAALRITYFPLGELHKQEVREQARQAGLANHDRRDSTGICFIGERPFREFLARYLPAQPGPMCTPAGEQVGEHQGLMFYTLGQRRGLGLGGRADGKDAPWYVVNKHVEENRLIVTQGDDDQLLSDRLWAEAPHWIGDTPPVFPATLQARVRYRQAPQACQVLASADQHGALEVRFDDAQRAVTPGQFVVFYDGERCLGGATIHRERRIIAGASANRTRDARAPVTDSTSADHYTS
ncbi:MAG: tRNA 2-thiouridine(34) synthase MnmA [Pseudomonadota bacterium]